MNVLFANKVGGIGHCIQTGTNELINDHQLLKLREIDSGTPQSTSGYGNVLSICILVYIS